MSRLKFTPGNKVLYKNEPAIIVKAVDTNLVTIQMLNTNIVHTINDVKKIADANPTRPILDIFSKEIKDFSKYKLAKAYIRWTKTNDVQKLTITEIDQWKRLIQAINKALK